MKKIIIICTFILSFIINNVDANDAIGNLKKRLNKIDSFHANFTQKVTDSNGNTVQHGEGDLWIKCPNLFNWHMKQPDENILISNGTILWIYNPSIEQVTVLSLKETINNSIPFVLFFCNPESNWKQYNVKQHGDYFLLTPKDKIYNLNEFTIKINCDGIIHNFGIIEKNNKTTSYYYLNSYQSNITDLSKFTFTPPEGTKVDDRRTTMNRSNLSQ